MLTRLLRTALILGVLFALACNSTKQGRVALDTVRTDYLNALFQAHPTAASRIGLHQYDGRLDSTNALAFARRAEELGRMMTRVQRLRSLSLPIELETESAALEYAIRKEMAKLGNIHVWRKHPVFYLQIPLESIGRMMRHEASALTSDRLKAIVISLNETDAVVAGLRANVNQPTAPSVEAGIETCSNLLWLLTEQLPPWGIQAAGVDTGLERSFDVSLRQATQAIEKTMDWLQSDLQTAATEDYAIGAENFVALLLFDSLAEIRLSDLLQQAETAMARDRAAFVQAAAVVSPGAAPAAAISQLAGQALPLNELQDAARQEIRTAISFVEQHDIITMPAELGAENPAGKIHVQEMPRHLRSPLVPFLSDDPMLTPNNPRDTYFLVSQPDSGWPIAQQQELAAHLSPAGVRLGVARGLLPGRYLQALGGIAPVPMGAQVNPITLLQSEVAREGWAHYAEHLMTELGFGSGDPAQRMLLAQRSSLLSTRFVACIRIHTKDMPLHQAAQLFQENAFLSPESAAREARDCANHPLAFAGALGKQMILDLHRDYQRQTGDQSLRSFHDKFLKWGTIPIPLVRKVLLAE
jgi:hypothetical protein